MLLLLLVWCIEKSVSLNSRLRFLNHFWRKKKPKSGANKMRRIFTQSSISIFRSMLLVSRQHRFLQHRSSFAGDQLIMLRATFRTKSTDSIVRSMVPSIWCVTSSASARTNRVPIRTINIAGNDNLELARKNDKQNSYKQTDDNQHRRQEPSKRRSPFVYLFMCLPIATFALGTWQIYRLQWKIDLIRKLENLVRSSPVEFPENLNDLHEKEYMKVQVRGYFDLDSAPSFIFPRPIVRSDSSAPDQSGLFSASQARNIGAQMIVPFVVTENRILKAHDDRSHPASDNNRFRILVNVGWVARETMDKINRAFRDVDRTKSRDAKEATFSETNLVGVIRKTEKREPFGAKGNACAERGYYSRRDVTSMADNLDTAPIFLEAYESYPISLSYMNETIKPIGAQTRVNLRNEHLSYIITWYSLTAIISYLWYKKIFKPRR